MLKYAYLDAGIILILIGLALIVGIVFGFIIAN